jgi:hypothetical protein
MTLISLGIQASMSSEEPYDEPQPQIRPSVRGLFLSHRKYHLWTMKPFGGSLAISIDALEKESQKKDAPSRSSRPPEACANENEATISR